MAHSKDKEISSENMTDLIRDISTNISSLQLALSSLSANTTERINVLQSVVDELRLKRRPRGRGREDESHEISTIDTNFKNSTINAINGISSTITILRKDFTALTTALSGQSGIDLTTLSTTISGIQNDLLGKEDVTHKVGVIDPTEQRPEVYPNVLSLLDYINGIITNPNSGNQLSIANDILTSPIKLIPDPNDVIGYVDTTTNILTQITTSEFLSWIESNLSNVGYLTPSQLNNTLNNTLQSYPTTSQVQNTIAQAVAYAPTYRSFAILDPALLWVVQHNMNTTSYVVTLRDANGNIFFAKDKPIDSNTFEVYLTSAMTGTVEVLFNLTP